MIVDLMDESLSQGMGSEVLETAKHAKLIGHPESSRFAMSIVDLFMHLRFGVGRRGWALRIIPPTGHAREDQLQVSFGETAPMIDVFAAGSVEGPDREGWAYLLMWGSSSDLGEIDDISNAIEPKWGLEGEPLKESGICQVTLNWKDVDGKNWLA